MALIPGRTVALALVGLVLMSCFGAESGEADRAVDTFHEQMNAAQYHDIYIAASDEFRGATPERDWIELLAAVQRKLGKVVKTQRTNVQVTTGTFGTAVNQVFSTTFSDGGATERFSWAIRDTKAVLVGYRIESPQLITR